MHALFYVHKTTGTSITFCLMKHACPVLQVKLAGLQGRLILHKLVIVLGGLQSCQHHITTQHPCLHHPFLSGAHSQKAVREKQTLSTAKHRYWSNTRHMGGKITHASVEECVHQSTLVANDMHDVHCIPHSLCAAVWLSSPAC